MQSTNRLTGSAAIAYAERSGLRLSKYADPTEGAREDLTVEEARRVAAEDPSLVYVDAGGMRRSNMQSTIQQEYHRGRAEILRQVVDVLTRADRALRSPGGSMVAGVIVEVNLDVFARELEATMPRAYDVDAEVDRLRELRSEPEVEHGAD